MVYECCIVCNVYVMLIHNNPSFLSLLQSVSADASIEVRLRLESQESQEVGDLLVSVGHAHSGHTHKKLRPPTDDNGSLSGGGTDGEGVVLLVTTNGDVSDNSTHLSDDESAPRPVSPSQSPPRFHQTPSGTLCVS